MSANLCQPYAIAVQGKFGLAMCRFKSARKTLAGKVRRNCICIDAGISPSLQEKLVSSAKSQLPADCMHIETREHVHMLKYTYIHARAKARAR